MKQEKKSGRGHVVLITDENGNPVRYPIRLSEFQVRPKFYVSSIIEQKAQPKPLIDKFQIAQLARDLNRLVERNKTTESNKKQRIKRRSRQKRF